VFHRRAVEALAPDEAGVTTRLTSLVRKEIVRPDKPVFPGDDAFRFRHLLIRDAAYDSLPKTTRADLHERFAEWLESHGQDLIELDELVGYHLEQAWAYRRQLGLPGDNGATLGERAAEHLARGGRRAVVRGDLSAAVRLIERATSLLPPESRQRLKLLPRLGTALIDTGRWEEAEAVFSDAATTAQTLGDRGVAADARLGLVYIEMHTDAEASHAKARADLEDAKRAFEELDDKAGLARALTELAMLRFWSGDNSGTPERSRKWSEQPSTHATPVREPRNSRLSRRSSCLSSTAPSPSRTPSRRSARSSERPRER
jgi:predicted ATPase